MPASQPACHSHRCVRARPPHGSCAHAVSAAAAAAAAAGPDADMRRMPSACHAGSMPERANWVASRVYKLAEAEAARWAWCVLLAQPSPVNQICPLRTPLSGQHRLQPAMEPTLHRSPPPPPPGILGGPAAAAPRVAKPPGSSVPCTWHTCLYMLGPRRGVLAL